MTEFDSFATQLLEESKTLLEKAKRVEGFSKITYYHSSLLLAISAVSYTHLTLPTKLEV